MQVLMTHLMTLSMKTKILLFLFCLPFICLAQKTRPVLINEVNSNIYDNTTHKITGSVLNGVLQDIINSDLNKQTDTYILLAKPPLLLSTYTLSLSKADSSHNGYLDSTHFKLFATPHTASFSPWIYLAPHSIHYDSLVGIGTYTILPKQKLQVEGGIRQENILNSDTFGLQFSYSIEGDTIPSITPYSNGYFGYQNKGAWNGALYLRGTPASEDPSIYFFNHHPTNHIASIIFDSINDNLSFNTINDFNFQGGGSNNMNCNSTIQANSGLRVNFGSTANFDGAGLFSFANGHQGLNKILGDPGIGDGTIDWIENTRQTFLDSLFIQGGNKFSDTAILGTQDNFDLKFITDSVEHLRITKEGNLLWNRNFIIGPDTGNFNILCEVKEIVPGFPEIQVTPYSPISGGNNTEVFNGNFLMIGTDLNGGTPKFALIGGHNFDKEADLEIDTILNNLLITANGGIIIQNVDTIENNGECIFRDLFLHNSFTLQDGTQSNGYVLTSDANGKGTWQPGGSGGISDTNLFVTFLNPDFEDLGDYSSVAGFSGQLGVWNNSLTPSIGNVVIWNLKHWVNLSGSVGTEPDGDPTDWQLLSVSTTTGFISERNFVVRDSVNGQIRLRYDSRGNIISYVNFNTFQFGNDIVYGNQVDESSTINCTNNYGGVISNYVQNGSAFNANLNLSYIVGNDISTASYFSVNSQLADGSIQYNKLANESFMLCIRNNGTIENNILENSSQTTDTLNQGNITNNYLSSSILDGSQNLDNIQNNNLSGDSYINADSIFGAISNNTLTSGSQILGFGSQAEIINNSLISESTLSAVYNQATIRWNTLQNASTVIADTNNATIQLNIFSNNQVFDFTNNATGIFDRDYITNLRPRAGTVALAPITFDAGPVQTISKKGSFEWTGLRAFLTDTNLVRNTIAWKGEIAYNHTIFTPTTGGTVNTINNNYNIINPAGALLAVTVNLPSSPSNNDVVYVKFTKAVTTVTYSNGTVVDGITSPIAGGLVVLTYDQGTSSWY